MVTRTTLYSDQVPRDLEGNLEYRRLILEAGYESAAAAEEIWIACKRDVLFYANVFGWVVEYRETNQSTLPFISWEFQDELILEIQSAMGVGGDEAGDRLIEKSRDMGVSWCCIIAMEHRWHFFPGQSFLLGSRTDDYVDAPKNPKSLFWKIDHWHKLQPRWLLPTGRWLGNRDPKRTRNQLENADTGSQIDGESTTKDFARGDRRTAIFLDEFAAVPEGHNVDAATADVTNCRIINSTPKGIGNAFYEMRSSGRIKVLRYHWTRHPKKNPGLYTSRKNGSVYELVILDKAYEFPPDYEFILDGKERSPWYDAECKRRPAWVIAQEVDIDYQGAGHQYFDVDLIRRLGEQTCEPYSRGELDFNETVADAKLIPNRNGRLWLWCPLDYANLPPLDRKYAVGVDVATGSGGNYSSNTVVCVIDCRTGEVVAELASPHISPTEAARYTVAICRFFGDAFLCWEQNGPGREFGREIMRLGYKNIYRRDKSTDVVSSKKSEKVGWWSARETKRSLLAEYQTALMTFAMRVRSAPSIDELGSYVYNASGYPEHSRSAASASPDPSGVKDNHGDRVIAYALAYHAMQERPDPGTGDEETESVPRKIPRDCMYNRLMEYEAAAKVDSDWDW